MDWRSIEMVNKYNRLNNKVNRLVDKWMEEENEELKQQYFNECNEAIEDLKEFKKEYNIK